MRSIIGVAIALCLVLAACTSASDEPTSSLPEVIPPTTSTTEAQVPEPAAPETTAADDGYLWIVGDCVDIGNDAAAELPYAPYGTGLLMDCGEPHTHEVYFRRRCRAAPTHRFPTT